METMLNTIRLCKSILFVILAISAADLSNYTDAQWSDWSEWSNCTEPCSGEITSRVRFCNSSEFTQENYTICAGSETENRTCVEKYCTSETEWHIPDIDYGQTLQSVIYSCIIFVPGVLILVSVCIRNKRKEHEKDIESRLIESRRASARQESLISYSVDSRRQSKRNESVNSFSVDSRRQSKIEESSIRSSANSRRESRTKESLNSFTVDNRRDSKKEISFINNSVGSRRQSKEEESLISASVQNS